MAAVCHLEFTSGAYFITWSSLRSSCGC